MRKPWIDLLFLHHHVTPATLTWRPDAPACGCPTAPAIIEVELSQLPLRAVPQPHDATCCA